MKKCPKCGTGYPTEVDGSKISDGMPGIKYEYCGSCGYTRAITKRITKREMLRQLKPKR